ncbi:unnamed protein product [Prorocentrum cordatum]|uniref:Uncharacterized protein n=1 Tax=Prorocentrum cordatum TaxID=2364126 RepID=A0ABN9UDK2_9DINO|nr:unnamed protein product [Polarella glacialis]
MPWISATLRWQNTRKSGTFFGTSSTIQKFTTIRSTMKGSTILVRLVGQRLRFRRLNPEGRLHLAIGVLVAPVHHHATNDAGRHHIKALHGELARQVRCRGAVLPQDALDLAPNVKGARHLRS